MAITVAGTYADVTMEGVGGDVSVETTHGDMKVRGGSGFVSLKSVQGEITLEKAKGRIEVRAVNESMHLADISGDLSAESTNGSIILDRIDSGNVDLYTVNGNISYDGAIKDKGLYRLTTHNGLIAMPIAEKANVALTVRTYNGGFRSTFPIGDPDKRNKRFSVTLGNGSAHVELESFGGTIALRRPDDPRPETERRRRSEKEKGKREGQTGAMRWRAREIERAVAEAMREVGPEIERAMAAAQPEIDAADRGSDGRTSGRDAVRRPAAPSGSPSESAAESADPVTVQGAPSRDNSADTGDPVAGSCRSGAISASGSSTKRRSRKRGCGTTRSGSSSTTSPSRIRSRSSVRGALA